MPRNSLNIIIPFLLIIITITNGLNYPRHVSPHEHADGYSFLTCATQLRLSVSTMKAINETTAQLKERFDNQRRSGRFSSSSPDPAEMSRLRKAAYKELLKKLQWYESDEAVANWRWCSFTTDCSVSFARLQCAAHAGVSLHHLALSLVEPMEECTLSVGGPQNCAGHILNNTIYHHILEYHIPEQEKDRRSHEYRRCLSLNICRYCAHKSQFTERSETVFEATNHRCYSENAESVVRRLSDELRRRETSVKVDYWARCMTTGLHDLPPCRQTRIG